MRYSLIFIFCSLGSLFAQELPPVSGSYTNAPLAQVLADLREQTGYEFYYNPTESDSVFVSGAFNQVALEDALNQLLQSTALSHHLYQSAIYISEGLKIISSPKIADALTTTDIPTEQVEKGLLFERDYLGQNPETANLESRIFEIGSRTDLVTGGKSTIAGYIRDSNNEPLPGAVVYTENPVVATSTDESGFYSITLPNGKATLLIQYSGMKTTRRNVVLLSNGQLNIQMEVDVIALQEITIESERDANIQNVQMGVNKLNVEETKNMPIVLGERDILKIATTFAGVQSPGEGASGFNVRGGKSDQNLILLNDATVYNASHFFGFFSVFNSDAIEGMEIYKSGIPATFGGRLSSVFDITAKKANQKKFSALGGISPITSKLTLEVPVIKDKAGLMVAGRTTYSNWILKRVKNVDFRENRVSFGDFILRYDHQLNENNELILTGYYSRDIFRLASDTLFSFSDFSFTNASGSARWLHRFGDKVDGTLLTTFSSYGYELAYDESAPNAFKQDFGVDELTAKGFLNYYLDDLNTLTGGMEVKRYSINHGTKTPFGSESIVKPQTIDREQGVEGAFFVSDEWNTTDALTLSGGLRYSLFASTGPQTVYEYAPGGARNQETVTDSTLYGEGDIVKMYHGLEPRLSARYTLTDVSSVKVSYMRTRQYIHTLTNSASISPTDIWRLSGQYILPQIADQYAVGYYRNFSRNTIETSLEVYFKDLNNMLDFKTGSEFLLNDKIETAALQGVGKSYGLELSLKKSGRLNGWANYSFARSFLQITGTTLEETVNGGAFYPANYDMPHTINVVANYKWTRRLSLSYNFTYNTGKPVTYPVGTYGFRGTGAVNYSDRNTFRIPDYLRMDFGISLEAGHKIKKLARSYWSLSVYNLLGRNNPYSVFFDLVDGRVRGYTLVVFGDPIPTITYNFRF